jgi:hypothetical protein
VTEEAKPSRARAVLKVTALVVFAVVPAGSVIVGVPYLLIRRRKRQNEQSTT